MNMTSFSNRRKVLFPLDRHFYRHIVAVGSGRGCHDLFKALHLWFSKIGVVLDCSSSSQTRRAEWVLSVFVVPTKYYDRGGRTFCSSLFPYCHVSKYRACDSRFILASWRPCHCETALLSCRAGYLGLPGSDRLLIGKPESVQSENFWKDSRRLDLKGCYWYELRCGALAIMPWLCTDRPFDDAEKIGLWQVQLK